MAITTLLIMGWVCDDRFVLCDRTEACREQRELVIVLPVDWVSKERSSLDRCGRRWGERTGGIRLTSVNGLVGMPDNDLSFDASSLGVNS